MTILMIDYHVEDFNRWKAVFDSDPMDRTSHGVVKHWIYRDPDDPNHHVLGMEFVGAGQAKAFREALAPMWKVSGAGQAWNPRASRAGRDTRPRCGMSLRGRPATSSTS